ncbi:hypothetical protein ES703_112027 [subsurface metagenome]
MTAIEYLRSLQNRVRTKAGPIDRIVKPRSQQMGGYQAIYRALAKFPVFTLEQREKFLKQTLITPFLVTLPDEIKKSLEGVYVGLLPTYDPNACAIHVPNNGPLVVLHTELLAALSFYNELQLLAGKLLMDNDLKSAKKLLNQGHRFIVDCFREDRLKNYPLLPPTLTEEELYFVQLKTAANELFVVAHEFAHIYLGHLSTYMSVPIQKNQVTLHKFTRNQQMELDADVQAVRWLVNLYKKDMKETTIQLLSRSVSLAIEVFMLFHIVEVNLSTPTEKTSHPSSVTRLAHILNKCGTLLSLEDRRFLAEMIVNASDLESFKVKL